MHPEEAFQQHNGNGFPSKEPDLLSTPDLDYADTDDRAKYGCERPSPEPVTQESVELSFEPVTSLQVTALRGETLLAIRKMELNDQRAFEEICGELSRKTQVPFLDLSQQVADKMAEYRKQQSFLQSSADPNFLSGVLSSKELAAASFPRQWLINRMLIHGQPAIMGGKQKTLKTSLMVDMVLSLGSGTRFLNHFQVPERAKVLLLSGESGNATIQETAKRICSAKQIKIDDCDVDWGFKLPRLSSARDLLLLTEAIKKRNIKVVVIDPLYLCLLDMELIGKINTANLFQTGPLLMTLSRACLDAQATPILVHHARKSGQGQRRNERIELEDLAFSGFAEFARQWLLVNPREDFDPDTGTHKLWLSIGGSAGQAGYWALTVEEGQLQDDFSGRHWKVQVLSARDADAERTQVQQTARVQKQAEKVMEARAAVLAILRPIHPNGETTTALGNLTGFKRTVGEALRELMNIGMVHVVPVNKANGRKGTMNYDGWACTKQALFTRDESETVLPPFPLHLLKTPAEPVSDAAQSSVQGVE